MIGKDVIEEKPVTLVDVKQLLTKRKKEGELSYEQNLTLEYCKKFNKLKMDKTKTLVGDLEKLDNMDEKRAIELCNSDNLIEIIFELSKNKDKRNLLKENISKIMPKNGIENIVKRIYEFK